MIEKDHKKRIIQATYKAVDDLISVLDKGIDFTEVDPEKIKAAASCFKIAQQDAFDMLDRAEEEQALIDSTKTTLTDTQKKIAQATGGFAEGNSK